jgi:hypothetical protein
VKRPPQAALALLSLFLPDEERESIPGDLVEEYQARASSLWLWKEVMRSLAHLAFINARRRPGRTLLAMVAGYVAMAILVMASFALVTVLVGKPRGDSLLVAISTEVLGGFIAAVAGGYVASRTAKGPGLHGVVSLCALTFVMSLVSLGSEPWWNQLIVTVVMIPGALLGGYVHMRRTREVARA